MNRQKQREVADQGYLLSILGRRHDFDSPRSHLLLNRVICGSAADVFKVAIVRLHMLDIPVVLYIHDEVLCEVDEDRADQVVKVLEEILPVEAHRGDMHITHLSATAETHQRWSEFRRPEYSPWRDEN